MKSVFIVTLTGVFSLKSSRRLIGGDSHSSYSFTGVQMNDGSLREKFSGPKRDALVFCRPRQFVVLRMVFLVQKLL